MHRQMRKRVVSPAVTALTLSGEIETFSDLYWKEFATDASRFALGFKYLSRLELLPFKSGEHLPEMKSEAASITLRKCGNQMFCSDVKLALVFYSRSIACAPYPLPGEVSLELALSFANRSAVFFLMKRYEACLTDSSSALRFGYPEHLMYKLSERRARCFRALGRRKEAAASAREAATVITNAHKLSKDGKEQFREIIKHLQVDLDGDNKGTNPDTKPRQGTRKLNPDPVLSYRRHRDITSAADCLTIQPDAEMIRNVIATRHINPGDIILIEDPYVSIVDRSLIWSYCNYCLKKSASLIPCKICDYAMFCSDTCRNSAWENYHSVECRLVPALAEVDLAVSWMTSLRILLVSCKRNHGLAGLYRAVEAMDSQPRVRGFDERGRYRSTDYTPVHHLRRRTPFSWDPLVNAAGAAVILNALEAHSNFLDCEVVSYGRRLPLKKVRAFVGGLLLRFTEIYQNTLSIYEIHHNFSLSKSPFAFGLYSTGAIFNHSCDPNVLIHWYGPTLVLSALRDIKQGEGIFMCYGQHFGTAVTSVRRSWLLNRFECSCEACLKNWPTRAVLEESDRRVYLCFYCQSPLREAGVVVKCPSCSTLHNLKYHKTLLQFIQGRLKEVKGVDDLASIARCVSYIKTVNYLLQRPNILALDCESVLQMSLRLRCGALLSDL